MLLGTGLACWLLLCASPGLGGSWVYDDLHMVDNPLYDEISDIFGVWGHTSGDYLETSASSDVRGVETYRPLTMLTLVATHVLAPTPLAHHLVGAMLHLLAALLLYTIIRRSLPPGGVTEWVAGFSAALFLMHPVAVEAYVWIHGRSDVVAGLGLLSTLAWVGSPRRARARAWVRYAVAFVLAFAACSSKETSTLGVAGVWVYAVVSAQPGARPLREACAAAMGVFAYLGVWLSLGAGDVEHFGHAVPLYEDPDLVAFAAKLLFLNAGALGSLRAAPMQSLAWLSMRPLTPLEWLWGGVFLAALGTALVKRRWGRLVLLSTALATWLPTVPLARALWFGMDRYLYMSLGLLLCALAQPLWGLVDARVGARRALAGAACVMVLAASASTFVASGFYRDHHTWVYAAIEEAPEDPTRYVVAASEFHMNGYDDAGRAVFRTLPPPPYPRAVWEQALLVALQLGLDDEYAELASAAPSAYPEDPALALHGVNAALLQGDTVRAVTLMQVVAPSPHCAEGRERLLAWARAQPAGPARATVLDAVRSLPCAAAPASGAPR